MGDIAYHGLVTGPDADVSSAIITCRTDGNIDDGLIFFTVIVQPNRLRLEHHSINLDLSTPLKVAVLADLRIGIYGGKPRHIRKLVSTINALSADAVLITGDWLYYPSADLVGQLMLFKGVNKPVYTVMSTSDLRYQSMNTTKQGQPLLEDTLASTFDVLDINYIGQQCTSLPLKCARAINKPSVVNQSTHQTNNQDSAEQENPNINPSIAVLCGWQDVPKQSTDIETSEATDKAMLGTEIANATSPVIILASRFDSISDLPKSLQPRPLLITGAAKAIQKISCLLKNRTIFDAVVSNQHCYITVVWVSSAAYINMQVHRYLLVAASVREGCLFDSIDLLSMC
ncbi:hypothetical protein ACOBWA_00880 [Psychrobacter sp. ER1]|uniref:hypothetical protein n=1 Tax=Psychrobacter sp. ER1 TaxID=3406645 RepID=UPI003B4311B8